MTYLLPSLPPSLSPPSLSFPLSPAGPNRPVTPRGRRATQDRRPGGGAAAVRGDGAAGGDGGARGLRQGSSAARTRVSSRHARCLDHVHSDLFATTDCNRSRSRRGFVNSPVRLLPIVHNCYQRLSLSPRRRAARWARRRGRAEQRRWRRDGDESRGGRFTGEVLRWPAATRRGYADGTSRTAATERLCAVRPSLSSRDKDTKQGQLPFFEN